MTKKYPTRSKDGANAIVENLCECRHSDFYHVDNTEECRECMCPKYNFEKTSE
jgi:hypothetical protein